MEGSFREYVVCFDRVKERNEEFSKTVGRVAESFSREVLGCNGEFWRRCNEEYHLGVFGCRFGELPLGVSCGVRIFLSVYRFDAARHGESNGGLCFALRGRSRIAKN